jgi:molybdopterin-guanine dinucleotide biosynthesis protein
MDVVLAEGFKQKDHPKIEDHCTACNSGLICKHEELLALVSDEFLPIPVSQFDLEDAAGVADFLLNWLENAREFDIKT